MKMRRGLIVPLVVLIAGVAAAGAYPGMRPAAMSLSGAWSAGAADTSWTVGELRENGLRIIPSGRSDASAVLDPAQFPDSADRHAYWIATQVPETLNQLYCWCGCENRGVHRSNLQCFEDRMGLDCDVCQGTAEIAYSLVQQGITDPAKIQAAVDAKWRPGT